MRAAFTRAVCYRVEAVCQTPLRTGGADGEAETVLRNWQGLAMIQGSSLAGALRGYLAARERPDLVGRLFGQMGQSGHLVVSDGLFRADAESAIRPRLRMEPVSGTADRERRARFDLAHIAAGARFAFSLTWMADAEDAAAELPALERTLAALHHGEIRLGAQKSNGFGRVSLTVTRRAYDLLDPEDRAAWLEDREDGAPMELPEGAESGQVAFTVLGRTESILVKGAAAEHTGGGSCVGNLREAGRPVIPGSSIKGAVRARAALIARWKGLPDALVEDLFGRESRAGDSGVAGAVRFEDAALASGRTRKISRIRIDRFTGGVIRGGLFSEEPVCAELTLRITAPAGNAAGCGLLAYALRDLGLQLYTLGSGDAVGRGRILVREIRMEAPDGRAARLTFETDGSCALWDPAGLTAQWLRELEVRT